MPARKTPADPPDIEVVDSSTVDPPPEKEVVIPNNLGEAPGKPKKAYEPYVPDITNFFGPGSTDVEEDDPWADAPDEVIDAIEEQNLMGKKFRCQLKKVGSDGVKGNAEYVTSYTNKIPSEDHVVLNYGPGHYILGLQWVQYKEGKRKNARFNIDMIISELRAADYEEYQWQKEKDRRMKRHRDVEKVRLDSEMHHSFMGKEENTETKQSAKEYLMELAETNKLLGINTSMGTPKESTMDKILPLLIPAIPGILGHLQNGQQQQQQMMLQMMTMMMQMNQSSTTQLTEVMKSIKGPTNGKDAIDQFTQMITGALDVKDLLKPEKESIFDKVCGLVEKISPMLVSMMAMPKEQRMNNPQVQMAKTYAQYDPNIQQVLKDPSSLMEMVKRLDATIGWEQTNALLEVTGYNRPAECPMHDQQRYPADDPRNLETLRPQQGETIENVEVINTVSPSPGVPRGEEIENVVVEDDPETDPLDGPMRPIEGLDNAGAPVTGGSDYGNNPYTGINT